MSNFAIITDSSCDLNKQLRERLQIHDYLHGSVHFPDGHSELADLDWNSITPEAYYDSMKDKKVLYRTGCPSVGETEVVFEKYLSAGQDVLCIVMSSALSATYQNCTSVAATMKEKYPERKIFCIDSLRYSTSLAVLLTLADAKRQSGATIEETAEYVENIKHCVHQMGPMDDLFFLVKMGRISNFKAFFGSLVGVNPMADFNSRGMAEVLAKFKGKSSAFAATLQYIEKTIVNPSEQTIFIAHSNRESAANILAEMVREKFHPKEIIINPVGMACGAAIGPGLCAAFYVGERISEDGSKEKAIMNDIVNGTSNTQKEQTSATVALNTDNSFILLGDSTCDMDSEMRSKYGVEYVKMNYVLDGKEYPASLDWESHSAHEYYDLLRSGKVVTTTQVSMETFRNTFESALQGGKDVLYISCSSALSGSVNTAFMVANELNEKYPNKVYCVDSLCSSLGQAMMLIQASEMRKEGKSAAEIADCINATKLTVNQCGTVATLDFLRRAGRIKASKAFFGNLFGVKPLIISDKIGQNYAVKKVKGKAASYAEIAAMIADDSAGYPREDLYLSHADCLDDVMLLKDEILKVAEFKNVHIGTIGPIVGASVGPGTVIAFCRGKEVTIEGKE